MSVRSRVVLRCFRITDSYHISQVFSRQKRAILECPFCCRPYESTRQCPRTVFAFGLNRTQKKQNQAMHPSRRSADNLNHSFLAATWVIAAVLSVNQRDDCDRGIECVSRAVTSRPWLALQMHVALRGILCVFASLRDM